MQIAPVPGVQIVTSIKPTKNGPMLSAAFDLEGPYGPTQDPFSKNGGSLSGGQDSDSDEREDKTATTDKTEADTTVNLFA